jgi:hypothetical protein
MLYVRIQFEKTDSGSRSDCPVLDKYVKKARWFYCDPDDVTVGYAGLDDTHYGIKESDCCVQVDKTEAIDFKKKTEYRYAQAKIRAVCADGGLLKEQKLKNLEGILDGLPQDDRDTIDEWMDEHKAEWGMQDSMWTSMMSSLRSMFGLK